MKVNKVYKIYRPMRVWFRDMAKLFNDIFNPGQSTHWYIRVLEQVETQKEKEKIIDGIIKRAEQRIKVYESN
jgi:hypothetical protein